MSYHGRSAISRHFAFASSHLRSVGLVPLIHGEITTLGTADALCGLIKFGSPVGVANLRFASVDGVEDDEGLISS